MEKEGCVRHYDCIETVIPQENDAYNGCPLMRDNCYDCEHMIRSGTLGGKIWIDCNCCCEEADLINFINNTL